MLKRFRYVVIRTAAILGLYMQSCFSSLDYLIDDVGYRALRLWSIVASEPFLEFKSQSVAVVWLFKDDDLDCVIIRALRVYLDWFARLI